MLLSKGGKARDWHGVVSDWRLGGGDGVTPTHLHLPWVSDVIDTSLSDEGRKQTHHFPVSSLAESSFPNITFFAHSFSS